MLKQIRYFQSVVKLGSFTEAAEEHYISQSAISQQIKALEDELGVKLLEMAVIKASKIIPEDEIYLRVEKSNAPSLKCMLKIGGYIHHEDEEHYYVRIKKLSKEDMYGRDQEQA